jgi:hypothetical protein
VILVLKSYSLTLTYLSANTNASQGTGARRGAGAGERSRKKNEGATGARKEILSKTKHRKAMESKAK